MVDTFETFATSAFEAFVESSFGVRDTGSQARAACCADSLDGFSNLCIEGLTESQCMGTNILGNVQSSERCIDVTCEGGAPPTPSAISCPADSISTCCYRWRTHEGVGEACGVVFTMEKCQEEMDALASSPGVIWVQFVAYHQGWQCTITDRRDPSHIRYEPGCEFDGPVEMQGHCCAPSIDGVNWVRQDWTLERLCTGVGPTGRSSWIAWPYTCIRDRNACDALQPCFDNAGFCVMKAWQMCTVQGGTPMGNPSMNSCSELDNLDGLPGACCLPGLACSSPITKRACEALGGTFQGGGVRCQNIGCN